MSLYLIIKAIIMGIVEGVTEFLPVSSTGHLIIVEHLLQISRDKHFVVAFEIVIQLGAILAIIVLFWSTLWPFAGSVERRTRTWKLWGRVLVGVIPAFILGYFLDNIITNKLFTPLVVSITLIFYGIVLVAIEAILRRGPGPRITDVHDLSIPLAFAIGLFQTLALIPGTSRSAATIIGAMILGLSRAAAAEFSFFMAIPVMIGASALTLYKNGVHFGAHDWIVMGIGFLVAFVVALVVVRAFMNFIRRHDFVPFGYYRILIGILVIILLVVRL